MTRPAFTPIALAATLLTIAPALADQTLIERPRTPTPAAPFPALADHLLMIARPLAGPHTLAAQQVTLDPDFLAGYSWRNLGPDRGGRSIATSGVVGRPQEAYFGA
ncbi:MAG: hypothetical protein OXK77_02030, partial [Gemmatimonadota bacterium]|nr:hypothetical protein [Gemmatimonadota bacterium]